MQKKIKIFPYKMGSRSATAIAKALEVKKVYPNRNYKPKTNHLILNWGCSTKPNWYANIYNNILNRCDYVQNAVDKIKALQTMSEAGVITVPFTTSYDEAILWGDGKVVERNIISGTQGEGIVIPDTIEEVNIGSPLYTEMITNAREYRVHVFNGEVIDLQQKKRRSGLEESPSGKIKNSINGWVYCRDGITQPPECIRQQAILAVKSLGLDFGAVDILSKSGQTYVLEVNTSPNLEGTTLTNYINAIKKYAESL